MKQINPKQAQLKQLEKQAAKIARKRTRLEAQVKSELEAGHQLDQLLKDSGFKRPKDFVKAIMTHFGIRTVTVGAARTGRGPGRPPKTGKVGRPPKAETVAKAAKIEKPVMAVKAVKAVKAGGKRKAKKASPAKAE